MKSERVVLWCEWGVLFVLIILAVMVRLRYMGQGFSYDEITVFKTNISSNDFLGVFHDFYPTNHLAYTILAWCSYHLLGGTPEWSTRLPALCFGIAGILIFWAWVRQYWGRAVALLAVLLLCFSPTHVIYSALARGYSALILFSILATWVYFHFLERPPSKRWLAGFVLMNVLALAFHWFFVFIILAQALHLGWLSFSRKFPRAIGIVVEPATIRRLAIAFGLSIVCFVLMFLPLSDPFLRAYQVQDPLWTPLFPLYVFSEVLSIDNQWIFLGIVGVMAVGLLVSARRLGGYFQTYFLFIIGSALLFWLVHVRGICASRYYSYLLPFLLILLASGLVAGVRYFRGVFKGLFYVLMAGSIAWAIWSWTTKPSRMVLNNTNSFKAVAEYANRWSGPGVRYCTNGSPFIFSYYCDRDLHTFKTVDEFVSFYQQGGDLVYFFVPSLPLDHEGLMIMLMVSERSFRVNYGDTMVFFMKGPTAPNKRGVAAFDERQGRRRAER